MLSCSCTITNLFIKGHDLQYLLGGLVLSSPVSSVDLKEYCNQVCPWRQENAED